MTNGDRIYKCRALVGTTRCTFEGDNDAAGAHWREAGHARCVVARCSEFLDDGERQTCGECVVRARAHLAQIVEALALVPVELVEAARRGTVRWDLLAWEGPGSMSSPRQAAHPEEYAGVESLGDPFSVLAQLHDMERCWREEFGQPTPAGRASVMSCSAYLDRHLARAAAEWFGFDDDAATLALIAGRLGRAVGMVNDPARREGRCPDCAVRLVQPYREPLLPVPDQQRSADGKRGLAREGRTDDWKCPRCRRRFTAGEYGMALRQQAADALGWVKVSLAADLLRRPVRTVWQWVEFGEVAARCVLASRAVEVDMAAVRALDEAKGRRQRLVCA